MKYRYLKESLWDDTEIDDDEIEDSYENVKKTMQQQFDDYICEAASDALSELIRLGLKERIEGIVARKDYIESFTTPEGFEHYCSVIFWYYKKLFETDDVEELQRYLILSLYVLDKEESRNHIIETLLTTIYNYLPQSLKKKYKTFYDLPFIILITKCTLFPVDNILTLNPFYGNAMNLEFISKFRNCNLIGIGWMFRDYPDFIRDKFNEMTVKIYCDDDFDSNFELIKKNADNFNNIEIYTPLDIIKFDLYYDNEQMKLSDEKAAALIGRCCSSMKKYCDSINVQCYIHINGIQSNKTVQKLLVKKNYSLFADTKHINF